MPQSHGFARRDFLQVGSLSLLGISLDQFLRAQQMQAAGATDTGSQAKAQSVILVLLEGGASQVDTFDPKPTSSFRPIATNVSGIQFSELLPRTAQHMDKLAVIRSMRTEENNHGPATHYLLTGHRPTPAMKFPSLGAIVTHELGARNELPANVLVPGYQGAAGETLFKGAFLPPECDPMVLSDPSEENFKVPDLSLPKTLTPKRLADRRSFLEQVDRLYRQKVQRAEHTNLDHFTQQALAMITAPAVRDALDLSREPQKLRDRYGRDSFGQSLLMARRLVEAGGRFVTAAGHKLNGWDAHSDNDPRTKKAAQGLDNSLPVLLEDLQQRGLLDSTLVIAMGEFGRTAELNTKLGRDHWQYCSSVVLCGGGIQGGQVVGASDERGAYVADRQVTMGDLFATIYKALGIDWTKEYMTPSGRPIKIANAIHDVTGEPLGELI